MSLFTKNHYHKHTSNVTERVTENINIVENRAPTDESMRILNELNAKAKDNILMNISVSNNTLNGAIFAISSGLNPLPGISNSPSGIPIDVEIHYLFNLNGKEFKGNQKLDRVDYLKFSRVEPTRENLTIFYYEFLSKHLANLISKDLITTFLKNNI